GRHFTIPRWLDQPARYLKYVILLLVIIFTILTGQLVFRPYDPWITYHHITSPELFTEFLLGFIILLLTIVGSFFFDRFFCKYLCPMGAFLAPFNKLGWFGIKRNKESCINCQACNRVCPMQINVAQSSKINQLECIGCNECVNVCPARDTLYVAGPRDKKKITPGLVNILVVAILIIIIGTTTATGDFQWKIPTLKEQVIQAGEIDSSLIKGKMTLQEIADAYQIPAQFLVEKLGVNEEDFHKPLKEINEKYGLTTETVRLIVDEYIKK
ncbi:MAG: 4Fe-4S binding protein, partial [Syntrophomonadaceae bacterium]|nr:4Fe-4S binding protein [Syntrophomonadaceae bacterium]